MAHVHDEDDEYESIPNSSLGVNMCAGAFAGITEHVVTYPLDVLKTRTQFININSKELYSSTIQSLQKIYTTEGSRALWRGVNSIFLGAGPAHALYFGTYEAMKESFKLYDNTEHHHLSHAAAGLFATVAHDGFLTPFDDCTRQVYQQEGLKAFYISYPVTLLMSVPFQVFQFTTYEYMRKKLNPTGEYSPFSHCVAGATAGAVASSVTNPLDVAKTLLQTKGFNTDSAIRHISGLKEAFKLIYQREGPMGFSRGLKARVLCHVPSTAVAWTTYEFLKMAFSSNK